MGSEWKRISERQWRVARKAAREVIAEIKPTVSTHGTSRCDLKDCVSQQIADYILLESAWRKNLARKMVRGTIDVPLWQYNRAHVAAVDTWTKALRWHGWADRTTIVARLAMRREAKSK